MNKCLHGFCFVDFADFILFHEIPSVRKIPEIESVRNIHEITIHRILAVWKMKL